MADEVKLTPIEIHFREPVPAPLSWEFPDPLTVEAKAEFGERIDFALMATPPGTKIYLDANAVASLGA